MCVVCAHVYACLYVCVVHVCLWSPEGDFESSSVSFHFINSEQALLLKPELTDLALRAWGSCARDTGRLPRLPIFQVGSGDQISGPLCLHGKQTELSPQLERPFNTFYGWL